MAKFLTWLLEHGQEASISIWILLTFTAFTFSLWKGWIYTEGRHEDAVQSLKEELTRERSENEEKEGLLEQLSEKLVEQRILNERATMAMEALKQTCHAQELEIVRLKGALQAQDRQRARAKAK